MSKTIVDMPKVTQMLDAGWQVRLWKGEMGSYEVRALHRRKSTMHSTRKALEATTRSNPEALICESASATVDAFHFDEDGALMTDDFTPEQALTRMAYKTFGEII